MTFDGTTTDPMQQAVRDALIAFMAATAQSQAEVIKEAQKAGIAHAQTHDDGSEISWKEADVRFGAIPVGARPSEARHSYLGNRSEHRIEPAVHIQNSVATGTAIGGSAGLVSREPRPK